MIGALTKRAKKIIERGNRRAFLQYTDKHAFVYFGHVDQYEDEHKLIRGLTLSPKHRDDHYSVGSIDGCDVALVERTDTIVDAKQNTVHFRWVIAAIDFSEEVELPHVFISLHSHSELFYNYLFTKFRYLQPVTFDAVNTISAEFSSTYKVYASPADALEAEQLLTPSITEPMARHFGTLTCEITDGSLYVYSEHPTVSPQFLETMVQNGIWLVKELEKNVAARRQRHDDTE